MNVILVAKENIPLAWSWLEDAMAEVIEERGEELTTQYIKEELLIGELQLWICCISEQILGWAITSVVTYPNVKRLRFLLLGGFGMDMWLKQIDVVEQWAAKMGIKEAEAWVRPGLRKKLEPYGYGKAYEVVTKSIEKRVQS